MMNKEELNDVKNKVKELQDKGYHVSEISNILGLSKIIVELFDDGYYCAEISDLIGVSEGFIQCTVGRKKINQKIQFASKKKRS